VIIRVIVWVNALEEEPKHAALLTHIDIHNGADIRQEGAVPALNDSTHESGLDLTIGDADKGLTTAVLARVSDVVGHWRPVR